MKKLAVIPVLIAIAVVGWRLSGPGHVTLGTGVMAPDDPVQTEPAGTQWVMQDDYMIAVLADFEITAKVLSKRRYRFGRETDLSPYDLALGWGRMSDEAVLADISVSQSGRWYQWGASSRLPMPRREIETHSANMHMIPAGDAVKDAIRSARIGDIVQFTGHLVEVSAEDGFTWRSSSSRHDTGDGACEVVYVKAFTVLTADRD